MLRIVHTQLELVRLVRPIAEAIGRHDRYLAAQLRRALSSAVLNTAEGSDQRGARRASHYAIALGSAREAEVALRTAVAWGYVATVPDDVVQHFGKVIGTLTKVTSR
jgi:four helix bundle protein